MDRTLLKYAFNRVFSFVFLNYALITLTISYFFVLNLIIELMCICCFYFLFLEYLLKNAILFVKIKLNFMETFFQEVVLSAAALSMPGVYYPLQHGIALFCVVKIFWISFEMMIINKMWTYLWSNISSLESHRCTGKRAAIRLWGIRRRCQANSSFPLDLHDYLPSHS